MGNCPIKLSEQHCHLAVQYGNCLPGRIIISRVSHYLGPSMVGLRTPTDEGTILLCTLYSTMLYYTLLYSTILSTVNPKQIKYKFCHAAWNSRFTHSLTFVCWRLLIGQEIFDFGLYHNKLLSSAKSKSKSGC